jgi:chemotaxis protein CheY-P-specific phosphatase CheC
MSSVTLQAALGSELARILEEAAFMLVEESEAVLPDPVPAVEACLHFAGQHEGTCWLAVSEEGANHLAKEMLGDELASDANNSEHATAELLNILTAWILDAWWGTHVEHVMDTPHALRKRFDETVVWALPSDRRVVVSTDAGYTFICGVTLEH